MNNRIRELAEQAEDWADSQNFYASDYQDYLMEKFAQLIVKECIDIANDTRYDGKVVANRIKFVFGVDE